MATTEDGTGVEDAAFVIHEHPTTTSGDSDSATWHERIDDDERPTGPASSIACRSTS